MTVTDQQKLQHLPTRLWFKLSDLERAIMWENGRTGVDWASAAVAVGQPPSAGLKLRRKENYFAARQESPHEVDSQSAQAG